MKRIEYAAAERGYENEAEGWTTDREFIEFENRQNISGGLDGHVIERTVTVSKWRPTEVPR